MDNCILSGAIKTKLKPKSSRKPVFLASLHTHDVAVEIQSWPVAPPHRGSSWKTKFSMMEDCSLRERRPGGAGQASLLENHPMHWRPPRKGRVPKLKFHSTKADSFRRPWSRQSWAVWCIMCKTTCLAPHHYL